MIREVIFSRSVLISYTIGGFKDKTIILGQI